MTMFCRNCGKELMGNPEFCPNCGAKHLAGTSFCSGCGAPTDPVAEVCVKCGVKLAGNISPKSRLATTLLCILPAWIAGIGGIHRFYLGKTRTALAMLLLSILGWITIWFLIGIIFFIAVGIWTLIDFIYVVSGNMKDKEGRLIKNW